MTSKKTPVSIQKIPFPYITGTVFLLNLGIIGYVIFAQSYLPPRVPLFYGQPRGEAQLASKIMLIVPPLLSQLILVVNTIITVRIKDEFAAKALISFTVLCSIFASISVLKIISIVGSLM